MPPGSPWQRVPWVHGWPSGSLRCFRRPLGSGDFGWPPVLGAEPPCHILALRRNQTTKDKHERVEWFPDGGANDTPCLPMAAPGPRHHSTRRSLRWSDSVSGFGHGLTGVTWRTACFNPHPPDSHYFSTGPLCVVCFPVACCSPRIYGICAPWGHLCLGPAWRQHHRRVCWAWRGFEEGGQSPRLLLED